MQLMGQAVKHTAFGKGIVTGQEGHTITVSFSQGEKRFLYPDAFQKFLTLSDEQAAEKVDEVLQLRQEKKDEKIQNIMDEQARQQKIHGFKVSVNSQAAFALELNGQQEAVKTWQVSTGTYLSGSAKGEVRIPEKLKPNSACLLTERAAGAAETERKIVGVFMVPEDFFGDECGEGLIQAHPDYRLVLPEKRQLDFWAYFPDTKNKSRWGSACFKYCNIGVMQRILFDIRKVLKETVDAEKADQFYGYYCRQNRLQGLPTSV